MKKKNIIILVCIAVPVLLIGVCSYTCFKYFTESVKNMQVFLEDLQTGAKEQLTRDGMNTFPQFSSDGSLVYYNNNQHTDNDKMIRQLMVYSLNDKKIVKRIATPSDDITLTSSVLFDKTALCYINTNEQENICLFSLQSNGISKLTNGGKKRTGADFSPNGKWISFLEEDEKNSRKNLFIIPTSGGRKMMISNSENMFTDVSAYTWTAESQNLAYISFVTLIVKSVNGKVIDTIDLTGLTNFKSISHDPKNSDRFILCARDSGTDLSFSFFVVSRKEKSYKLWKENRSFWEMNHKISPDGSKIVYSSSPN
jgi:Tol biopolymer transport system component